MAEPQGPRFQVDEGEIVDTVTRQVIPIERFNKLSTDAEKADIEQQLQAGGFMADADPTEESPAPPSTAPPAGSESVSSEEAQAPDAKQAWLERARAANPNVPDDALLAYYDKKKAPVSDKLPTLDSWLPRAKQKNPEASDADLKAYWQEKYGSRGAKAEESKMGSFARGAVTAAKQLPQLGAGLIAGAGAIIESIAGEGGVGTAIKEYGANKYQEKGQDIADLSKPTDSFTTSFDLANNGDYGALAEWMKYGLGYAGAKAVEMLATGGLGYVGGKVALEQVAKGVAEKLVAKEAARIAETEAGKTLAADVLRKQAVSNVAGNIGQKVALAGTAVGMEGGEIFGDVASESAKEGRALSGEELAKAFGSTLAAGGLEFVGDKFGFDLMVGKSPVGKLAAGMPGAKGRAARGVIQGAVAAPVEGATELLQTLTEEYGKGKDPLSDASMRGAIDAAALAVVGGAAIGGVSGAVLPAQPMIDQKPTDDSKPVDESISQIFNPGVGLDEAIATAFRLADTPTARGKEAAQKIAADAAIAAGLRLPTQLEAAGRADQAPAPGQPTPILEGAPSAEEPTIAVPTTLTPRGERQLTPEEVIAQERAKVAANGRPVSPADPEQPAPGFTSGPLQSAADLAYPESERSSLPTQERIAERGGVQKRVGTDIPILSSGVQSTSSGIEVVSPPKPMDRPTDPKETLAEERKKAVQRKQEGKEAVARAMESAKTAPRGTDWAELARQKALPAAPSEQPSLPSKEQIAQRGGPTKRVGTDIPILSTSGKSVSSGIEVVSPPKPKDRPTDPREALELERREVVEKNQERQATMDRAVDLAKTAQGGTDWAALVGAKKSAVAPPVPSDQPIPSAMDRAYPSVSAIKDLAKSKGFDLNSPVFKETLKLLTKKTDLDRMTPGERQRVADKLKALERKSIASIPPSKQPTAQKPTEIPAVIEQTETAPVSDIEAAQKPRSALVPEQNAEMLARAEKAKADLESGAETSSSILDFLRSRGGVQDQGSELSGMDPDKGLKPFQRKLINPKGLTLDEAAEAADEAGLIQGRDINALLTAIDREVRGGGSDWYQEATTGPGALSRERVEAAVEKILADKGRDIGKDVERIKGLLLGDLDFVGSPYAPKSERDWQRLIEQATGQAADQESTEQEPADLGSSVDAEAHQASTSPENDTPEPTQAQKEAGNYKKGHIRIAGMEISIENPAGSERSGVDPNGKAWTQTLTAHYGYILGTKGKDKDHLDIFIKVGTPSDYAGPVFVVDQNSPKTNRFDEHKVVLGVADEAEAKALYLENYAADWTGFRSIKTFPSVEAFKGWLATGDMQKPAGVKKPVSMTEKREAEKATEQPDAETPFSLTAQDVKTPKAKVEDRQTSLDIPPATSGTRPIIGREAQPEEAPLFSKAAQEPDAEQTSAMPEPEQSPTSIIADALRSAADKIDKKPTPTPRESSLTDVGEELWYNRRNRTGKGIGWGDVQGLNDTLKVKEVTKEKVWPRPDYEALVTDGMHPFTAHLVKQIYDRIATKPDMTGTPSDADMQLYIETVQKLREAVFSWAKDAQAQKDVLDSMLTEGAAAMGRPMAVTNLMRSVSTSVLQKVWPADPNEPRRFSNMQNNKSLWLIGGRKLLEALQPAFDEAKRAVNAIKDGWPASLESWQKQFEVKELPAGEKYSKRVDGKWVTVTLTESEFWIYRKRKGDRSIVASGFKTQEEAVAKAKELAGRSRGGEEDEAPLPLESLERTGPEKRKAGENVTPQQFKDAFGFRGVNFGNWTNQAERQAHINQAYDAFMDLADILNLPPGALSLNNLLGVAFGAQGSGSAAAHFVPGVNEINLTKTKGAGSLAHEWAHALDHYFAVQAGEAKAKDPFLTHIVGQLKSQSIRPEVAQAVKQIVTTMKQRAATPEEMAAQRQERREKNVKGLESWLKSIRHQINEEKADALTAYDRIGEKLKLGDVGEKQVPMGKTYIWARVDELRKVYKDATGRLMSAEDTRAINAWVSSIEFAKRTEGEEPKHIPQFDTEYYKAASEKDAGKGGAAYWSIPTELWARAFQSYVQDKLAEKTRRNDYLSRPQASIDGPFPALAKRYPQGEERQKINVAFDTLIGELKTKDTDQGTAIYEETAGYREPLAPTFYSQTERVLEEKMPNKANFEQVKRMLLNNGVKPDELKWIGLDDYLKAKESHAKQDVLDFVRQNQVQVSDVMKGDGDWAVYDGEENSYFSTQSEANEYAKERGINITPDTVFRASNREGGHGAKFASYQLPGGTDYRELLLTLPVPEPRTDETRYQDLIARRNALPEGEERQALTRQIVQQSSRFQRTPTARSDVFNSSHFSEPNILAHVRFNTRTVDGKKVLFLEEVQSDWHQAGRKKGYQNSETAENAKRLAELKAQRDPLPEGDERMRLTREIMGLSPKSGGVPDAPFKKTWHELALKRMVRYAAEHGYDELAWTTGDQQAERYDLSKQVDRISYNHFTGQLMAWKKGSRRGDGAIPEIVQDIPFEKVEDYIGKEAARKLSERPKENDLQVLEGEDLRIGGEGMKGFYDSMLPAFLNKYGKKWGAKVGTTAIETGLAQQRYVHERILGRPNAYRIVDREAANGYGSYVGDVIQGSEAADQEAARRNGVKYSSVHTLPITDAMKRSVLTEGQVLFEDMPKHALREGEQQQLNFDLARAALGDLDRAAQTVSSRTGALPRAGIPARTLALGFTPDLIRDGVIDLTGRQVDTAEDLARLAQVYRDPRFETFRIIYVKKNQIVGHEGMTSRLPGLVMVFHNQNDANSKLSAMQARMDALGATGYYMLHNHPSGNSRPSAEDYKVTEKFAMNLPGFKGHIVIDSNEYSTIDFNEADDLEGTRHDLNLGPDRLLTQAIPHPLLGKEIHDVETVAEIGKAIQSPQGYATVVYLAGGRTGGVRAIQEVSIDFLAYQDRAAEYVREQMVTFGAPLSFVHYKLNEKGDNPGARELMQSMDHLIEQGIVRDYVVSGASGGAPMGRSDFNVFRNPDRYMGMDVRDIPIDRVAEGQQSAYGNSSDEGLTDLRGRQTDLPVDEVPPTYTLPEITPLDNVIRTMQDKNIDLVRLVETIKQSRGQVADELNPVLKEEMYMGRTAQRTQDFLTDELRPLIDAMRLNKVTLDELDTYLHARHAQEANAYLKEINPDREDNDALSGMTDAEAQAILSAADRPKMDRLAARVDAILAKTRTLMVDYGLEAPETVAAWAEKYSFYVPLHRDGFEERMGTGQGKNIRGSSVRTRTGSTRDVKNILAHIALDREKTVVRGEKMRPVIALAGLIAQNPNSDIATLAKPMRLTYTDPATGLLTVTPGDVGGYRVPTIKTIGKDGTVEYRPDPLYKGRENVVNYRLAGVDHAIIFNEQNPRALHMAQALKDLDVGQLNTIMQAVAPVTRYLASINTQYNPVFGIVNFVRDVQFAMLALNSTPLANKKMDVLKYTKRAISGIYQDARAVRRGEHPTSPVAALWERFQHVGGPTGYRDLFRTSDDRAKAIERMLDPDWWQKTTAGKILTANGYLAGTESAMINKIGKPLFEWLSDYNQTMENAVRLGVFQAGIENGMSDEQAASHAKNITVNFNKKGQIAAQMGALFAFFNASVQGTARLAETLFEKGQLTQVGKKILAGGVTLGVIQAVGMALAGFGDDDPPEFVRAKSIVIPVPGTEKGYVAIPMPLGFNMIPTVGRLMAEALIYGKPGEKGYQMLSAMIDTFSPVGGAATPLQLIAPTMVDPIVALSENKDWTGRKIYREDFDPRRPTPGFQRAKDSSTPWARGLAEAINYATMGSDYAPGKFSPTPDAIDYLITQATGGVGRELSKTAQVASGLVTGEEIPLYKVPLAGRFAGSSSGASSVRDAFYRNVERLHLHDAELTGRRTHREDVVGYLKENPEARLADTADRVEREVSKMMKQKREMVRRGERERVKLIDMQIQARMARFNEMVEARQAQ